MSMTRRDFAKATAAAGAAATLARWSAAQEAAAASSGDELKVAIIGCGIQGRVLMNDMVKIPGVRFVAACDIWEKFSLRYATGILRRYKQVVNKYTDYREMLEKEKGLDAVIIATPDWMHAEHAIACMKAGINVYCEKEMSYKLDLAKQMVQVSQETGKLLQIGHQRRSSPVYLRALAMIEKEDLCGRLTTCYGQWNRPAQEKLDWPEKLAIPPETLAKFGYENMDHFRNWRWYKKYSAGPIADLGSHQIDIFSWFLGAEPCSVMAVAGGDYYKDRDWYEDVMCLYEYKTKKGSARAYYQVLNTNGYGNFYERYRGDKGTINITETSKQCWYCPEPRTQLPDWLAGIERVDMGGGPPVIPLIEAFRKRDDQGAKDMGLVDERNVHHFHLENFFTAVRANNKKLLTCPGEVAYGTAVAVLSVVPAIEAGKKIELTEADYHV